MRSTADRIAYLKAQPGETVPPSVVAKVLGGCAYGYNIDARNGRLTLPHIWHGRNLRIFKAPIIRILQGGM